MISKLFTVMGLAVLAACLPAAAQNTFKLAATLNPSSGLNLNFPAQVIATDVLGNGKSDLVCADAVLTNNGKGIFSKAFSLPATFRPSGFVAMDVNRDGRVDLITLTNLASAPFTESIVVYTNGGLSTSIPFGLAFGVSSSTANVGNTTATSINGTEQGAGALGSAGDVYGNGRANLFYYNSFSNSLALYTNNGAGVFGSNTTFSLNLRLPAVADVNGDGKVDFISPSYTNNLVYIFTNNGGGIYGSNAAFKVRSPLSVVAADVNGDSWVDLICQTFTNQPPGFTGFSNTISIWTNNGGGVFGSNTSFTVGTTSQRIMDIKAAQVFGDGQMDLVFAVSDLINQQVNTVLVYTNNGLGGFGSNTAVSVGSFTEPAGVAVADVNGDGTLDLISANNGNNTGSTYGLTIFTNTGTGIQSGSFVSNSMPVVSTNYVFGLLAADLYRNGKPALISAVYPPGLLVQTNNGSGGFGSNTLINGFSLNNNFQISSAPVAADIFGNGLPALVFGFYAESGSASGVVMVLTNNGAGVFGTNSAVRTGLVPNAVVAADVNGDGKPDLLAVCYTQNSGSPYALMVLTNNGAGGFGTNITLTLPSFSYLAVDDVNGDGRPDLIVAYNYQSFSRVTVYTNISAMGFGPLYSTASSFPYNTTYQLEAGGLPSAVITADVNNDNKPDIIIANDNNPGTLSVLTNNGSGLFGVYTTPGVGAFPHALVSADVNGDGKADLISANWGLSTNFADARGPLGYGTLSVLNNNGSGLFTNTATFSTGMGPTAVIAADVNGDGKPDLITANTTSFTNQNQVGGIFYYGLGTNTLSILFNTSNFVNTVVLQTLPGASVITYGQTLNAAGLTGGAATNEAGAAVAGIFTFSNMVPLAGTANYPVTFTPAPPTDYQPFTFNLSVTVNQLAAILKGKRAYDGTTNAVAAILSLTNKVGVDNVTIASGTGGLAAATVGTNSLTSLNNLALGGTAAANYTLVGATGLVVITQAVNAVALTSSQNPSAYHAGVSFTATLPAYATGTIQFLTNGVNFDLEALVSGTVGSVAAATLPLGSNIVTAAYSGDANDLATTNSLGQLVLAPQFNAITLGADGLIMSGSFGPPTGTFYIVTSTNLTLPFSQWLPVSTNQFDPGGNYNVTNAINAATPQNFYLLQVQ